MNSYRIPTHGVLLGVLSIALGACTLLLENEADDRRMTVESVKVDDRTSSPVVLLREDEGQRRVLPIWIGVFEARSIAMAMEEIALPRPNTHDLIQNILEGIDGELTRVVITELRNSTYYAKLELLVDGRTVSIDSCPSDAIAIATRTATPVYATSDVLRDGTLEFGDGDAVDAETHWVFDDAPVEVPIVH